VFNACVSSQSEWGRIADDGTVFVKTADGEREIGSWQAGDSAAGMQFYVRRYEDLATEVDLLEKRLASGSGDPAHTRAHAHEMKEHLATAAVIGDLGALERRLDAVALAADERAGEVQAAREQARADAVAAKEQLVVEAEQLAESATSWKASGDRLRAIVEEWKTIRGVDRRTDDTLWKRFAAARDAFGRRRGQHFAQLDAERGTAKVAKEALVTRAEELSGSTDWRETAAAMRDLMQQWKASPRAARDVEDALWTRFRAAQDAFFARRSETFAERDAEQVDNQRKKEAVIERAAALDVSDPKAAQAALRDLQAEFDSIGHVPREAMRRIDDRMRAAEQRVRDAVDAEWRAASVESNPFLAELRARLVEAEQKLERARKAGDAARIKRAEDDVAARKSLLPD
jgi:FtsZ-binding cell division protein ZapB